MKKYNVAAYIRLSVDDGDKAESNSVKNQKEMIRGYINNQEDMNLYDFYVDDGYSGTSFDRPGFKSMIQDMYDKKFDTIMVKDLSRLGRNYIDTGRYIEDIFPENKIRFIAINDNVDLKNFAGGVPEDNGLIVPFKNIMNDAYAGDISKKTKSVLNTKVKNGDFIGSVAPFGYLKDPKDKHKMIVDYKASLVVKKIFQMILEGQSKSKVVDELNKKEIPTPSVYFAEEGIYNYTITESKKIWTRQKLDIILKNQSYTGDLVQGKTKRISHRLHKAQHIDKDKWVVVKNHHEPLISKEDFIKVQDMIYSRDIKVNGNNKYDLFAGYLYCKECGNSLVKRWNNKNMEYYYCSSHLKNKNICNSNSIRKENLEKVLIEAINKQIDLVININKELGKVQEDVLINYDEEILKTKIKSVESQINKYILLKNSIKEDYLNKIITTEEFEDMNIEYTKKLKKLIKEKSDNELELSEVGKTRKNSNWIKKFTQLGRIERLNKNIIDEIIDRIDISNSGSITITYKYQDEYFLALDFINSRNCDIISVSV